MINVGVFMDGGEWSDAIDYAIRVSMEPKLNIHRGWSLKDDNLLISDRLFQLTNLQEIATKKGLVLLPQLGYLFPTSPNIEQTITRENNIWKVTVAREKGVEAQAEILIERIIFLVEKMNERSGQ